TTEHTRLASHFIQGAKRKIAIEGRVFDAFRHYGTGELLEAHNKEPSFGTLFVAETCGVFQQQHTLNEVENGLAHGRVPALRSLNRRPDVALIFSIHAEVAGSHVRPIDGEASDHLAQSVAQVLQRKISEPAVMFRDPV